MLVFVDSSILCTDFYMRGTKFELLKRSATIVLSEIVLDEVKNKYKESLLSSVSSINKNILELNRMIQAPIQTIPDILQQEVNNYDDFLELYIIASGMTIAEPYPNISHKTIVERALSRKKPFKQNGQDGYRDFLVWQSYLNFVQLYASETVYFLTLNKKDFSDDKDENALHPDLVNDLVNFKIDKSRIQYWSSFDKFIEKVIKPQLKEIEEEKELTNKLLKDHDNFLLPLEAFIHKNLIGVNLHNYDVSVYGENTTIEKIYKMTSLNIEKISQTLDNKYLLELEADIICLIRSHIAKSEIVSMRKRELEDLTIIDKNPNLPYVTAETENYLKISLEAIYDMLDKKFLTIELENMSDYSCYFCQDYDEDDD